MNLDQALITYLAESRELLQDMEDSLLRIESESEQVEIINAIFRAAHTIKGSGGLFSLHEIVAFTHVVESVLDRLRADELKIEPDLVALLLECGDHIGTLLDQVSGGSVAAGSAEVLEQRVQIAGDELIDRLSHYLGIDKNMRKTKPASVPQTSEARVESMGSDTIGNDNWHISVRFGRDVLRNGMDPLSFVRYLGKLGEIVNMNTLCDAMPALDALDPEACYLAFEINFKSKADKVTIEEVFEFVREDSSIRILPPRSRVGDFVALISELPEEQMRLGEILVRCGTLTQHELDLVLELQAQSIKTGGRQIGEITIDQGLAQAVVVNAALEKQKQVNEKKARENSFIRVDAERLDALINLVGELVIASASAALQSQREGATLLQEATSNITRLVEEVRDNALKLRMVQIGETFKRFNRVVRDVSKELGKDIELVVTGGETELDKTVVEKISDPLTHLVRNSMDHGIEPAEVRAAKGKPVKGTLSLNAYHDSGSIVIEVSDDGGGLNKEKILQKAIERGLVPAGQSLSDREIYNLIFEAGFSTAEQVSNISGRGVGMDVVRRNIQALRGTVELDSEAGVGTIVRIRLPLTLAIIDGFLVGVGESAYVVPLEMVLECVELTEAEKQSLDQRAYVNLRGEVLPFIRLRDHFGLNGQNGRRENIVVVKYGEQKAGFVVDKLMGEFQTVIKPLGKMFTSLKGIGGSTILGTGEVALILDVPALIRQASVRDAERNEALEYAVSAAA